MAPGLQAFLQHSKLTHLNREVFSASRYPSVLRCHKLAPSRRSLSHACLQGQHLVKENEIQLLRWRGKCGETCQKTTTDKQLLTTSPNRKMRIAIAKAAGSFAPSSQRHAAALPEVHAVSSMPRQAPTGSRARLVTCTATRPAPARTSPSLHTTLLIYGLTSIPATTLSLLELCTRL